jgi:hypothetical protein
MRDKLGRFVKGYPRPCDGHRFGLGKNNMNWKGGRIRHPAGYVLLAVYDHPYPNMNGRYVFEHRLVMEKKVGRYLLPSERVHHLNGRKDDNRISNLVLFKNDEEHNRFHHPVGKIGSKNGGIK